MILAIDVETSESPKHFPWREGAYLSVVCAIEDNGKIHHWVINHNSVGLRPMACIVEEIQQVIDRADLLVGHNIKFDLHWLKSIGLRTKKVHDTMVCEYLIIGQDNRISVALADTALRYELEPKLDIVKQYWKSGVGTADVPLETLLEYCIHDTLLTLQIYKLQLPRLTELGLDKLARLHNYFVECLQEIEENGMCVDVPFLKKAKRDYWEQLESLRVELQLFIDEQLETPEGFTFNMSSNDHLSVILYGGTLPLPYRETYEVILKSGEVKQRERWSTRDISFKGLGFKANPKDECKKKGFYKTNKAVLETLRATNKYQRFFVETIQKLSAVEKIYSTYLDGMEKHITPSGIIHPNFNQTLTVTGRLSSSQPNFQNLPRGGTDVVAKRLFKPRQEGRLIVNADLGALEWCCAAQLANDEVMIEEIVNGIDAHQYNAEKFFEDGSKEARQTAKTLGFRMIYGGSPYAFFMDGNMPNKTLEEWEDIHSAFYRKYKGLKVWHDANYAEVCKRGTYQSFTGRRYVFHKDSGKYSRPAVCNYITQGTATGDIVPFVMMLIRKQIRDEGLDALMICQVHDSIVLDVKEEDVERVAFIAYNKFVELPDNIRKYWGYDWRVPMTGEVEVGYNYKELEKYIDKKGNRC